MSDFDDLLGLCGSTTTTTTTDSSQSADPFDPIGSLSTGDPLSSGDALLDFGFDTGVSTQNGDSVNLKFEANTNPLYEFMSNTDSNMATDASNPLYDMNEDVPQKEVKQEAANPLYDFTEQTNGNVDLLMNGDSNSVHDQQDLLAGGAKSGDNSGDLLGADNSGDLLGADNSVDLLGADNSGDLLEADNSVDLLGDSGTVSSENVMAEIKTEETNVDLLGDSGEVTMEEKQEDKRQVVDTGDLLGGSGDLIVDSGPVASDDFGATADTPAVEISREESQEEEEEEEQDKQVAPAASDVPNGEPVEQVTKGPESVDSGPKTEDVAETNEQVNNNEDTEKTNIPAEEKVEVPDENEDEKLDNADVGKAVEPPKPIEPEAEPVVEEEVATTDECVPELETEPESESAPIVDQSDAAQIPEPDPVEVKATDSATAPVEEQVPEPAQESEAQLDVEKAVVEQSVVEPEPVVETTEPAEQQQKVSIESEQKAVEPETVGESEQPKPELESITEPITPEQQQVVSTEPELPKSEPELVAETPDPVAETQEPVEQSTEPVAEVPEPVVEQPPPEPEKVPEPPVKIIEPEPEEQVGDDVAKKEEKEDQPASEIKSSPASEDAAKQNGSSSEVKQNGVSEEDAVRDPNIFRETREKEEVHFAEMSNVRQKFESGKIESESSPAKSVSVKDEYDQGGEFENQPVPNPDVVKETDQPGEELPEVGMAKNILSKFKTIQEEQAKPKASSKRPSPPRDEKVEYESQPKERLEQYTGKSEEGVFESQPKTSEDVIRSGDHAEEYVPESGTTKNILNRFKEIETEKAKQKSEQKREITPDRTGKVEYVSEPRGQHITYEDTKVESGVFENVPKSEEDVVRAEDRAAEVMPESGTAKNLLSKFKQMETEAGNKPPPSPGRMREITPDRSGKVEYVSEPKGFLEKYEPQVESGEFESNPQARPEVVRCEDLAEEVMPEAGSAKKTMERFKELQKQSTSPVTSSNRQGRSFTPPREASPGRTVAGVIENNPEARPDVVRSGESIAEPMPEQGTTRNILNKFKEIQSSKSQSVSPGNKHKEFTPPPESGVYENKPKEHLVVETRQAESGVLESTPSKSTADIARERDSVSPESELPEQGLAKNLVSKFKQLESSSSAKSTSSASPRFKEFTPPRDSKGPLSPKSPAEVTTNGGVQLSDLPGQYQPQEAPSLYENNPEVRTGVFREGNNDSEKEMPAPNTTMSMLQKFKSIQNKAKEDSKTPEPVRKEKGMFKVVQTDKCSACEKTVYAMEKLEMNGHIYHKTCFKCSHCSARLTAKTFSMNEGVIYCVNHFKQLFARKGNYDEGFGRQQYKKKWQDEKKEGAVA